MEQVTINLVQNSFEKVKPIASEAAKIFYKKLFELDPSLVHLFPSGEAAMNAQGSKLMSMLSSAVAGLDNLDALVPILQNLGKRHVDYKVEASHYKTVGKALIDTLKLGLGDEFTPDVEVAWTKVYGTMSSVMIEASYQSISNTLK